MKQLFNYLREMVELNSVNTGGAKIIGTHSIRVLINRAESKWESDYCKMWTFKTNNSFVQIHGSCYSVDDAKYWKCCPYCCKKIKIAEVE